MIRGRLRLALVLSCVTPCALAQPAAYVDKVLEEGPQPSLKLEPELGAASGWGRSIRVDYTLARDTGSRDATTHGLSLNGHLETPNHGVLSASAAVNQARQARLTGSSLSQRATLWRLDQLALPLDGGWLGRHSAGHVATPQVALARGFGRLGLPSAQIEGLAAQYNHPDGSALNVSAGRPGVYTGLGGISGFEAGAGRLLHAGAQTRSGFGLPGSTLAVQLASAQDVQSRVGSTSALSSDAAWAAWHWQGRAPWADTLAAGSLPTHLRTGGLELQWNALASRTRDSLAAGTHAWGTWLDARWRSELLEQSAGAFHLEPGLRWGTFETVSDLRGAYWRGDYSSRQWFLGGHLEWADTPSDRQSSSTFGSLAARYRIDTRNTALSTVSVRRGLSPGESVQLGWMRTGEWGQSQLQIELLRSQLRKAARIALDHSFPLDQDTTLAVYLGLERGDEGGLRRNTQAWGLLGSLKPWSGVTLDANLRGDHGDGRHALFGSLGLGWSISSQWQLLAQWNRTIGRELRPNTVLSPIGDAIEQLTPVTEAASRVQVTLRYVHSAGRSLAPIGGKPGTGSGQLTGHVFFDTNANDVRDAAETGAPEVTVILNGRYIARTDREGRYQFPAVAPGTYRLQVVTDNIPLPWNLAPSAAGSQTLVVRLRDVTIRDFALRRDP